VGEHQVSTSLERGIAEPVRLLYGEGASDEGGFSGGDKSWASLQRARWPGACTVSKSTPAQHIFAAGRETILLVDDEQVVRTFISALLRKWGYSVLEAALPSEAIAIAERMGDAIKLLLTDVVMPEMRGGELARRVLPMCRCASVLFISGYPDDDGLGLGGRGARVSFLSKPFTPESLARKVREAIDGR